MPAPKDLAATAPNSSERFQARRDLPALAKRLREVRVHALTLNLNPVMCYPNWRGAYIHLSLVP